jgi:O-antigen/teichoic acid export membrane protein
MGQIRKQAIYSSIVVYVGFAIGFLNTYLFVRKGIFTTEQYGLTRLLLDLGTLLFSFSSFGVLSYIYKFYPYYKSNLKDKENDQLSISLITVSIGFLIVSLSSIIIEPLVVRKFSERSQLLVNYYYWILPVGLGLLIFSVLEAFAWFMQKSVLTNFLKEVVFRVFQLLLLIFFILGWINFPGFVKLFSLSYIIIALIICIYFLRQKTFKLQLKVSRVTQKLRKKIIGFSSLIYSSHVVNTVAQYIDSIIIASISIGGLSDVGIYTLSTFISNTIQVPQRTLIAATIPALSTAWKEKNRSEIQRIYSRSSINLLLVSLLIFFLIWLNIDDLFSILNINENYELGKTVILLLGISRVIDAGTGVNSQIIVTSNYWKFEIITNIVLLSALIPMNYLLVKTMGINGSALSNLISFALYNIIRIAFIYKKFDMQPFSIKTILSIVICVSIYFICFFLFKDFIGMIGIVIRSTAFILLVIGSTLLFNLSPDAKQLVDLFKQKLSIIRK